MIILLGRYEDIIDGKYDSKNLISFFVPKGTVIKINPKVLHFSPFKVDSNGFKCGVILPYGTNMEFIKKTDSNIDDNYCLFKTKKWLLAHQEYDNGIANGAYVGLMGENTKIKHI